MLAGMNVYVIRNPLAQYVAYSMEVRPTTGPPGPRLRLANPPGTR